MKEMEELVKILNEASKAYYKDNTEILSNLEYDKLYDKLLEMENKTGIILENSPTKNVGYEILESLKKVNHELPLLSLDKTKQVEKLESFLDDKEALISFKIDGLTLVIIYNNGKLVKAITRGNGIVGEDVTHNVKEFKNLPKVINYKKKLVLRGEAFITYKDFEIINENLKPEEKYKNPRNLCSGTVRQLNSKIMSKRNVNYLPFSIVEIEDMKFKLKSQSLEWLKNEGFEIIDYKITNTKNIKDDVEYFKNKAIKKNIPSDGLVITYDDIEYSKSLGETSKFPKDSIAFKWKDEVKETTLLDIEWNTSRTGLINPVAILKPIELEGTTVTRASLHNISIVENLKLGIGDTVTVYKANMIIPQIHENLTKSNTFILPTNCLVCDDKAEIKSHNGIKFLYCTNSNCKAKKIKLLTHYVSRNAMNIEGLSESTLEKFVRNNFINNYVDIYKLEKFEQNIKELDGFSTKSYNNLINSIEKSKKCKIYNFIYALGIKHIGLLSAKLLCKHYNFDIKKIENATIENLNTIEGFGEIMSKSVYEYFNNEENIKYIEEVLNFISFENIENSNEKNILNNLQFCITGSLNNFENRKKLQEIIESMGGKVSTSVTSKTNYLINNNKDSNSSKNVNAKKLDVKIITEDEFIKIFNIER